MTRQRRRARRGEGASLVEFALILPVLILLLVGMITAGISLSRQNSVKNAVRETTRFGAVLPAFDTAGNLGDLYDQVVSAATGDLDTGTSGRQICVALIDADDTWDYHLYDTNGTPTAGSDTALADVPPACKEDFDAGVGSGTQRIWARAERTSEIDALFTTHDVTLTAQALTRYER